MRRRSAPLHFVLHKRRTHRAPVALKQEGSRVHFFLQTRHGPAALGIAPLRRAAYINAHAMRQASRMLPPEAHTDPTPPSGVPRGAVLASSLPPEQQAALLREHPGLAGQMGIVQRTVPNAAKGKEKRMRCVHAGALLYEWDQSLDEVNMYLVPPAGAPAADLDVQIRSAHVSVGLLGAPAKILDHPLGGPCKHSESFWTLEEHDGAKELHLTFSKMTRGQPWASALEGHAALDPLTATEVRKDIMLERLQAENPGMDFSGASFNGEVPDASRFMGGIGYG